MIVDCFSLFTILYHSVILDGGGLFTVANNSSAGSVCENTVFSKTGDISAIESLIVPKVDLGSSCNKSVTWLDFVVSVDNNGSIKYQWMSLKGGTTQGVVGVTKSENLVELQNWNR